MSTHEIGREANENVVQRFTRRAAPKTLLAVIALGVALGVGASASTEVSALPNDRPYGKGSCYYRGEWYPHSAIVVLADGKQYMCQYGELVPKAGGSKYAQY